MTDSPLRAGMDDVDRDIIVATQNGMPLTTRPYHRVADELGLEPAEVMRRMQHMIETGVIRRIAVVPNHYALGYAANGMSVWDVPDDQVRALGALVGALEFVSHCYHRPRHLPDWSYNLFAMVHGRSKAEVEEKVGCIAELLGVHDHGHDILYSSRILKKTGLRLCGQRRV